MAAPRKLTDRYIETEVDGEVLLIDMDGGELFAMDGTAAAAWRLMDGERSLADIAAALGTHFAGDPQVIVRDCAALVDELAAAGLVAAPAGAC